MTQSGRSGIDVRTGYYRDFLVGKGATDTAYAFFANYLNFVALRLLVIASGNGTDASSK
jgi:hypothetical protein